MKILTILKILLNIHEKLETIGDAILKISLPFIHIQKYKVEQCLGDPYL